MVCICLRVAYVYKYNNKHGTDDFFKTMRAYLQHATACVCVCVWVCVGVCNYLLLPNVHCNKDNVTRRVNVKNKKCNNVMRCERKRCGVVCVGNVCVICISTPPNNGHAIFC